MQKLAEEAPLKDGAQLFILEDTTGAGKTEAAIMLAARMMEAGKGEGLYFALPTMATANAMYERLAEARRLSRRAFRTARWKIWHVGHIRPQRCFDHNRA